MNCKTFVKNIIHTTELTGEPVGHIMWRILNNNDVLGLREMMIDRSYDPYHTITTFTEMIEWLTDHINFDPETEEILSIEAMITHE
jgi:hypothetical protein